ncbi:hypothetical protein J1N35_007659, partial [Gossypium stocksii]
YIPKWVRKMACKMAYFRPHRQRHEHVSQSCVTPSQATRPCVPCSFQRVASQAVTRPST